MNARRHSAQHHIRFTPDEDAMLRLIAERRHLNTAATIRQLVTEEYERILLPSATRELRDIIADSIG